MCGFTLIGKQKTFRSLPPENSIYCRCMGFRGCISEETEKRLLEKDELIFEPLIDLSDKEYVGIVQAHVGLNMKYRVCDTKEGDYKEKEIGINQFSSKYMIKYKGYSFDIDSFYDNYDAEQLLNRKKAILTKKMCIFCGMFGKEHYLPHPFTLQNEDGSYMTISLDDTTNIKPA